MRGECVKSEGVRGAGVEPRDTLGELGLIPTNGRGFLLIAGDKEPQNKI